MNYGRELWPCGPQRSTGATKALFPQRRGGQRPTGYPVPLPLDTARITGCQQQKVARGLEAAWRACSDLAQVSCEGTGYEIGSLSIIKGAKNLDGVAVCVRPLTSRGEA